MEYQSNQLERFSDRVENYIKYRPHYPVEIINFLNQNISMNNNSIIADIGSGTGISSLNFLSNGNKVIGIEPNKNMREAAESLLKEYTNFISIDGSAEQTNIDENSVDIITAGQAFHWFNIDNAKNEFKRILKKGGWVVLIWNEKDNSEGFGAEYENILKNYGTDYLKVKHTNISNETFNHFFENGYKKAEFVNNQIINFEQLKGRLLSSSYIPLEGEKNIEMIGELKRIFNKYQSNNKVTFGYTTKVYYGQL